MPIIFNVAAFLQAIVIAVAGVILYLINIEGIMTAIGLGNRYGESAIYYLAFFIVAPMHRRGLKGHVFFIPTWIITLWFPFVICWWDWHEKTLQYILFCISTLLMLRFAYKNDLYFRARFQDASVALNQLKYLEPVNHFECRHFWALASQAFVRPGHFFLWGYPLRRLIFIHSVTRDQFVQHYREFVAKLKMVVEDKGQHAQLTEMEKDLNEKDYWHEPGMLNKIATIIEAHAEKYGSESSQPITPGETANL